MLNLSIRNLINKDSKDPTMRPPKNSFMKEKIASERDIPAPSMAPEMITNKTIDVASLVEKPQLLQSWRSFFESRAVSQQR